MKKQTKFNIFLVISIFLTILIIKSQGSIQYNEDFSTSVFGIDDTTKNCELKLEKVNQKADSASVKWDEIEKAIEERKKNPN